MFTFNFLSYLSHRIHNYISWRVINLLYFRNQRRSHLHHHQAQAQVSHQAESKALITKDKLRPSSRIPRKTPRRRLSPAHLILIHLTQSQLRHRRLLRKPQYHRKQRRLSPHLILIPLMLSQSRRLLPQPRKHQRKIHQAIPTHLMPSQ